MVLSARAVWPLLFLAVALPAMAQETPVQTVYACTAVTGTAERLACFDAAVAALKQAQKNGDVAITTKVQAREAERQAFGLAAKPAPVAVETPDTLTLAVTSITKAANGDPLYTMENGQVWRQTDGQAPVIGGKAPGTAQIRKAALGSFMLKLGGRTAVRVTRVK